MELLFVNFYLKCNHYEFSLFHTMSLMKAHVSLLTCENRLLCLAKCGN